jgi:HK97 family phage prohead protease
VSDLILVSFSADLLIRSEEDGGDGRTVSGVIVPWNVPTPTTRDGKFATRNPDRQGAFEAFKRGALTKTLTERSGALPLFAEHDAKRPVGVMTETADTEIGQLASFKMLRTREGEEGLELIREGIWTGFSLGFFALDARTERSTHDGKPLYLRSEVKLDHVAVLRNHAYDSARVLALREQAQADNRAAAVAAARQRLRSRSF